MTLGPFLTRYGVTLRSVQTTDAAFIIQERRSSRARMFLGETKNCIMTQQKWIEAQQQRNGDYYFICQTTDGNPVGTIGVSVCENGEAEWGRFLICPAYNAALQCLSLLFDFCFDGLRLRQLRCTVVATNEKARQLYEWVGHEEDARPAPAVEIGGRQLSQVYYELSSTHWQASREKVLAAARRVNLWRKNN